MGEPHGERTLEANFCFGLVCKVVVKVQKELYSFQLQVGHVDKILDGNFCFDLICKVVVEVKRNFILFTYMYKKLKVFFPNFINHFHEFIVFLSCHLVLICPLITISLC